MEKLGGQEKGICQGAPSRRLTHNMAGGMSQGGGELTSVTLDTA